MNARKSCTTILCIILIVAATGMAVAQTPKTGGSSPYVADMAKGLDMAATAIEKSFKTNDINALFQMFGKIKEIGLSYDTSITVPADMRILQGKSQDELTMLMGMYVMDGIYASIFEKRVEALLTIGLQLEEELGMHEGGFWSSMKVRGAQPANRQERITGALEFWTKLVRTSRQDTSSLRNLVCGFYGSTIETFYVLAKMGLQSGLGADYLAYMNGFIPRLAISRDILNAYPGTPDDPIHKEMVRMFDTVAKGNVIESLMKVMTDSKGKLTEKDLRAIVAIIDTVRAPLVKLAR